MTREVSSFLGRLLVSELSCDRSRFLGLAGGFSSSPLDKLTTGLAVKTVRRRKNEVEMNTYRAAVSLASSGAGAAMF